MNSWFVTQICRIRGTGGLSSGQRLCPCIDGLLEANFFLSHMRAVWQMLPQTLYSATARPEQCHLHGCYILAGLQATKRRLELLKGHDMAAYLKEVSSAKSGRIQKLLAQTDGCLQELMKRLQATRPQTVQSTQVRMLVSHLPSSKGERDAHFCSSAQESPCSLPPSSMSRIGVAATLMSRLHSQAMGAVAWTSLASILSMWWEPGASGSSSRCPPELK